MKLRQAKDEEKTLITRLWKEIFAHDDGGHSDYYFEHAYDRFQSFVLADDLDQLVSCAQVHTKVLDFNGKPLQTSFIVGVFTLPHLRGRGYMHELMEGLIDLLSHRDLLTLIQGYNPDLYVPFGFEKVYYRSVYTILPKQLPILSPKGVSTNLSHQEMFELYREFTRRFTGYVRRKPEDFVKLVQETHAMGGRLLAFHRQGKLEGYATVFAHRDSLEIDEVIYLNATALMTLLCSLSSSNLPLKLSLSPREDLTKILPDLHPETTPYTNVRLNDVTLFNELFKVRVKNVEEAFMLAQKPLWLRENQ